MKKFIISNKALQVSARLESNGMKGLTLCLVGLLVAAVVVYAVTASNECLTTLNQVKR